MEDSSSLSCGSSEMEEAKARVWARISARLEYSAGMAVGVCPKCKQPIDDHYWWEPHSVGFGMATKRWLEVPACEPPKGREKEIQPA